MALKDFTISKQTYSVTPSGRDASGKQFYDIKIQVANVLGDGGNIKISPNATISKTQTSTNTATWSLSVTNPRGKSVLSPGAFVKLDARLTLENVNNANPNEIVTFDIEVDYTRGTQATKIKKIKAPIEVQVTTPSKGLSTKFDDILFVGIPESDRAKNFTITSGNFTEFTVQYQNNTNLLYKDSLYFKDFDVIINNGSNGVTIQNISDKQSDVLAPGSAKNYRFRVVSPTNITENIVDNVSVSVVPGFVSYDKGSTYSSLNSSEFTDIVDAGSIRSTINVDINQDDGGGGGGGGGGGSQDDCNDLVFGLNPSTSQGEQDLGRIQPLVDNPNIPTYTNGTAYIVPAGWTPFLNGAPVSNNLWYLSAFGITNLGEQESIDNTDSNGNILYGEPSMSLPPVSPTGNSYFWSVSIRFQPSQDLISDNGFDYSDCVFTFDRFKFKLPPVQQSAPQDCSTFAGSFSYNLDGDQVISNGKECFDDGQAYTAHVTPVSSQFNQNWGSMFFNQQSPFYVGNGQEVTVTISDIGLPAQNTTTGGLQYAASFQPGNSVTQTTPCSQPSFSFEYDPPATGDSMAIVVYYTIQWTSGGTTFTCEYGTAPFNPTLCNVVDDCANVDILPNISNQENEDVINGVGLLNGQFTITPSGGTAPYTIAVTGQNAYNNTAVTNSSHTFVGLSAGGYNISIIDANGCGRDFTLSIEETEGFDCGLYAPLISGVVTNESFEDTNDGAIDVTVTQSANGGNWNFTYSWSSGQTTEDISSLAPGVYELTVTATESGTETACSATETFEVLPGLTSSKEITTCEANGDEICGSCHTNTDILLKDKISQCIGNLLCVLDDTLCYGKDTTKIHADLGLLVMFNDLLSIEGTTLTTLEEDGTLTIDEQTCAQITAKELECVMQKYENICGCFEERDESKEKSNQQNIFFGTTLVDDTTTPTKKSVFVGQGDDDSVSGSSSESSVSTGGTLSSSDIATANALYNSIGQNGLALQTAGVKFPNFTLAGFVEAEKQVIANFSSDKKLLGFARNGQKDNISYTTLTGDTYPNQTYN